MIPEMRRRRSSQKWLRLDARVHYFCHPHNIGMIANFSYAIESVQTPYFSMLCDDDLLLPKFYEIALACFKTNPEADFCLHFCGSDERK